LHLDDVSQTFVSTGPLFEVTAGTSTIRITVASSSTAEGIVISSLPVHQKHR
jgi:hypothetical protein